MWIGFEKPLCEVWSGRREVGESARSVVQTMPAAVQVSIYGSNQREGIGGSLMSIYGTQAERKKLVTILEKLTKFCEKRMERLEGIYPDDTVLQRALLAMTQIKVAISEFPLPKPFSPEKMKFYVRMGHDIDYLQHHKEDNADPWLELFMEMLKNGNLTAVGLTMETTLQLEVGE